MPRQWLEQVPLLEGEQLFAVLGNASDCDPITAWQQAGGQAPVAIWAGTAYAEWEPVMPYIAVVPVDSAFLDWAAECGGRDWGWLAVSAYPLQTIVDHLCGLTKVLMPDGQAVFFRIWDGGYLLPILQVMGTQANEILPVFRRYWINGERHEMSGRVAGPTKSSPWWAVPATVLQALADRSSVTLVDNLLQWLEEERPDLHGAFVLATLKHKVTYCVRSANTDQEALAEYLASVSS